MWTVLVVFATIILNVCGNTPHDHGPAKASATINNPKDPNGPVQGSLHFSQQGPDAKVYVQGEVRGLAPNTKHGFHVHEFGNITGPGGCDNAGDHFNPFHKHHGAPNALDRHEGDLGNIVADDKGVANISIMNTFSVIDGGMTILGFKNVSILNRAIVVHAMEDDLGLGDDPLSITTGNSGSRIACGIIRLDTEA